MEWTGESVKTVLSLSLSGTVVIVALLCLRPLYKKRLSESWQYYIWLVAVIRMLLPLSFGQGIYGGMFQESGREAGQEMAVMENLPVSMKEQPGQSGSGAGTPDVASGAGTQAAEKPVPWSRGIWRYAWLLWLVTALLLFVRKVTVWQCFMKYLAAGSEAVDDIDRLEQFGKLAEGSRIRRPVGLYTNRLLASPVLAGVLRPRVVLCTTQLPDTDFCYIVQHELVHYRRKDMYYKWLVQLALCIHWFNPLVYLMEREINRACELACDEAVVKYLGPKDRRAYGDTLLRAVCAGGNYGNPALPVTLCESGRLLKERLGAIMNMKKRSVSTVFMMIVLSVVISGGALSVGAYTSGNCPHSGDDMVRSISGRKKRSSYDAEYASFGITRAQGAYFYRGRRVRILMDIREDQSFENMFYDKKGKVSVRLSRGSDGAVMRVEKIRKKEADAMAADLKETGQDMREAPGPDMKNADTQKAEAVIKNIADQKGGGSDASARVVRLEKADLPARVKKAVASCGKGVWYVIEAGSRRYIYYDGLPANYAFVPRGGADGITVAVSDMGRTKAGYVLLAAGKHKPLTVLYNGTPVSYKERSVK